MQGLQTSIKNLWVKKAKSAMRRVYPILFDSLFGFSLLIILTGGSFLINSDSLSYFRSHPKHHRLLLSLLSFVWVLIFAVQNWRGTTRNNSYLVRFLCELKIKPFRWILLIFTLLAATFSYSSFIRHYAFHSSFDFAIFAQAIWNTWQGNLLYSSIKGGICLLGDHFSPILIILAPIYGLTNEPGSILVAQGIAAASSVFPIYLIAKHTLEDEYLALIFGIAYALYLPLRNAVRFDFHPELLGDPLILWGVYFILKSKLKTASIFLFTTLLTKEIACAPVAMLGLYCWWVQRKPLFGIVWFLIAIIWFLLVVKFIAPLFSHQDYFYLSGNYLAWQQKGGSAFLNHLFQPSSLTYLKKIFLPVGFISFLSPSSVILTFPILLQNLAARNPAARSIYFQYTAFLTPFVFVSAIYGFRNLLKWTPLQARWPSFKLKLIGVYWLLGASLLLMGVSEYHVILEHRRGDSPHLNYIRNYLKTVPTSISVRTHEFFAPHLSNRKELHIFENRHPREGASERAMNATYVILDKALLGKSSNKNKRKMEKLISRGYRLKHTHNGFYVFGKTTTSTELV